MDGSYEARFARASAARWRLSRHEGQYNPGVRAGERILFAGIVVGAPPKKNGAPGEITPEALEAAYGRAFTRIESILESAGAGWAAMAAITPSRRFGKLGRGLHGGEKALRPRPYSAWTAVDIYIRDYGLTAHPLIACGCPSIGRCWSCMHTVAQGEDRRACRWRGAAKPVCDVHSPSP